jgi:hypothetical protein
VYAVSLPAADKDNTPSRICADLARSEEIREWFTGMLRALVLPQISDDERAPVVGGVMSLDT